MEKQFFTPKRIREALAIESRRLTYLVERGHVIADVQNLGERGLVRLFSPYEALKVGLIEYFCTNHGMTLDRAAKLALVASMAPMIVRSFHDGFFGNVGIEIAVTNGQLARLELLFANGSGEHDVYMYLFHLDQLSVGGDFASMLQMDIQHVESSCSYVVSNILTRLASQLGLTVEDINCPKEWPFNVKSYMPNIFIILFKNK